MKYIIPIIIIAVISLYFFLPASKDDDSSAKIERLLNNLVESGERKDINVVMEYFSPDYEDAKGRTYPVIRNIVETAFERFEVIEGGYSNLIVSTTENENGDTETIANLDIWIKGIRSGSAYKLIGSQDKPQNIEIGFESVMFGGWKIIRVKEN